MKNYDEIIARIEKLQELPVSEEMLGAYVEGTLEDYEVRSIDLKVQENLILSDIVDNILITEDSEYEAVEDMQESLEEILICPEFIDNSFINAFNPSIHEYRDMEPQFDDMLVDYKIDMNENIQCNTDDSFKTELDENLFDDIENYDYKNIDLFN